MYWNREGITGFGFGYVYYHDQWAEIVEDEFKVGDYVTTTTEIDSYYHKYKIGETFQITKIDGPNLLFAPFSGVNKARCRKATSSEIEKYKAENEIEIGGYKAEFKDDKVSFGCKKNITKEDLLAIQKVKKLTSRLDICLNFYKHDEIELDDDKLISDDLLNKLISKL